MARFFYRCNWLVWQQSVASRLHSAVANSSADWFLNQCHHLGFFVNLSYHMYDSVLSSSSWTSICLWEWCVRTIIHHLLQPRGLLELTCPHAVNRSYRQSAANHAQKTQNKITVTAYIRGNSESRSGQPKVAVKPLFSSILLKLMPILSLNLCYLFQ